MWDLINSLRKGPENMCQVWDEGVALMSLVLSQKPTTILEIGVRQGGSAVLMAEGLEHLRINGMLAEGAIIDCVDPEPNVQIDPARQHLAKYINVITGRSPEDVPNKLYDLIHIDGDHQYDAVMKDLQVANERSHRQTRIIMHDANYPDVRRAVESFAMTHANAFVIPSWTKRPERSDDWGGQAMILFKDR